MYVCEKKWKTPVHTSSQQFATYPRSTSRYFEVLVLSNFKVAQV
jgi:hypothetical protein